MTERHESSSTPENLWPTANTEPPADFIEAIRQRAFGTTELNESDVNQKVFVKADKGKLFAVTFTEFKDKPFNVFSIQFRGEIYPFIAIGDGILLIDNEPLELDNPVVGVKLFGGTENDKLGRGIASLVGELTSDETELDTSPYVSLFEKINNYSQLLWMSRGYSAYQLGEQQKWLRGEECDFSALGFIALTVEVEIDDISHLN